MSSWDKAIRATLYDWAKIMATAPSSKGVGWVVDVARKFVGTRYVLGGSSTGGIDCSGLVMRAYRDAINLKLPHKAARIRLLGREVPLNQLAAGDVVYYITGSPTEHVGIYDGSGNVIHATRYFGKAVIEPLDNWRKRGWLSGARRLV